MTGALSHHSGGGAGAIDVVGWLPAVLVAAALVGVYLLLLARRGRMLGRRWSHRRTASWVFGSILVAAASAPPLTAVAQTDARGHMVQHLVLGMYAPLALVLARPATLLLAASAGGTRRRLVAILRSAPVHGLSHPAVAGVLNVGGLYLLYLTDLYTASTSNPAIHALVNVHLVLAGGLFTWSVAGPDPAPRRPGMPTRLAALVLTAGAHAFLAKTLFAQAAAVPATSQRSSAAMEAAAELMYYGGDVAEVLLATALFATWYRARGRTRPGPPAGAAPSPLGDGTSARVRVTQDTGRGGGRRRSGVPSTS